MECCCYEEQSTKSRVTYGILKELNEVALKHCRLELRIEHTQQVVVVVVVVLSHNQVRAHRTGSSHSGAEEYPREKHTQPKVVHGVYITADAINSCLHQKHIKVKLGVYDVPGPCRCIRLITHACRNQLFRLPPEEDYHVYRILHKITTHIRYHTPHRIRHPGDNFWGSKYSALV